MEPAIHGEPWAFLPMLPSGDDCVSDYGNQGHGVEKVVRDPRVRRLLEGANEIMRTIATRALTGR